MRLPETFRRTALFLISLSIILLSCSTRVDNSPSEVEQLIEAPAKPTTAIPILTTEEKFNYLNELVLGNPDCILPCWSGIRPGLSTLENMLAAYAPFGNYIKYPFSNLAQANKFDYFIGETYISFVEQQGVIALILITITFNQDAAPLPYYGTLSIANLVEIHGVPDETRLTFTTPIEPSSFRYYSLSLVYLSKAFIISYEGHLNENSSYCPNQEIVQRININLGSDEVVEDFPLYSDSELHPTQTIIEVNPEHFTTQMLENSTEYCIGSLPADN